LFDAKKAKHGTVGLSKCYRGIGKIHLALGNYDKVIISYMQLIDTYEELLLDSDSIETGKTKIRMSACYNDIGNVYWNQGKYKLAVEFFQKALKINEDINNKKGIAAALGNIGLVHWNQESYDLAVDYFLKALEIYESLSISDDKVIALSGKRGISRCYGNIGVIHEEQGNYDQSIEYYQKALEIFIELDDNASVSICYMNIGLVHSDLGNYETAIEFYEKSISISEEIGDKSGLAHVLCNIASTNISLASAETLPDKKQEYYQRSVDYGIKSIEIAEEIGELPGINFAAKTLRKAYKGLGMYDKAFKYAEIYITTQDSMFNEDKINAIQEMETRYQTEKKEQQIKLQETELAKTLAENSRQRIVMYSFIAGFIIVVVFTLLLISLFIQKKKANRLLLVRNEEILQRNEEIITQRNSIEEKNEELNQQNEEIATQRDEIEEQRDKVILQKEIIEGIHTKISQSIDYAKRIQTSILPDGIILNKYFDDHFVLFKPRDVVSGDFYWVTHVEDQTIVTAADCTGHGVPGAFMSMLGVSFLREIVINEYITHPGVILRKLRKVIINALKQKEETGDSELGLSNNDGMDMALISIDHKTNMMQYAGANNPLYIINPNRKEWPKEAFPFGNNLGGVEIKPDKMPISIYKKMDKFITHEIQLEKGDQLYMFSDGFADQFGGEDFACRQTGGKKFKYKPFKKLLLDNADKPMQEQKEILEKTFEEWRGDLEQIDDVVVLGIKI